MKFVVQFKESTQKIPVQFKNLQQLSTNVDVEYYNGSYKVVPKVTAQELETKERFLTANIQILEIPYYDVTNNAGGITVTIGG